MKKNDRVRTSSVSPPTVGTFASAEGTPLVIDSATGAVYTYAPAISPAINEVGARSGWNDMLASLSAGKAVGANAPTWAAFRNGISAWEFSATVMNEIWVNVHIVHDYAPGTVLYPHIHWSTAGTNTGNCRWGIEYTFAKGFNFEAFPATTTLYLLAAGSGVAYRHYITEVDISAALPAMETDGILMMRVFRDAANALDTLTDTAFGLFVDLHYQSDGMLTNEKTRTFTKRRGQL